MDTKFTAQVQAWLAADASARQIAEGAELLLRMNRNRWMYHFILRTSDAKRLEYELKKHLRIRLDGLTRADVARMDTEVMERAGSTLGARAASPAVPGKPGDPGNPSDAGEAARAPSAPSRGKRADHDTLPEKVQALYDKNGERYQKMRRLYDTLRHMERAEPCDRYELLKQLDQLDRQYRRDWKRYDSFSSENKSE